MKYTQRGFLFSLLTAFFFAALPSALGGNSITVGGNIASTSEELLSKAVSYAVAKDQAAFDTLIASGAVIWLKGGVEVQIVDTKIFSGKVKIRPIGQTLELWTLIEGVTAVAKEKPETPKPDAKPVVLPNASPGPAKQEAKSAKYAEGYEWGFICGEAAHNDGRAESHNRFLDSSRPLSPIEAAEYDAAEKNGAKNFLDGFRKGHTDGFAGLARGGLPQASLPKLPFVEKTTCTTAERSLGPVTALGGDEKACAAALHSLLKAKPTSELFSVVASGNLGGFLLNVRLIYDAKNKFLIYLKRRSVADPRLKSPGGIEDDYDWRIWFNIEPRDFAARLPFSSTELRSAGNRSDNKQTAPVIYERHKKLSMFP